MVTARYIHTRTAISLYIQGLVDVALTEVKESTRVNANLVHTLVTAATTCSAKGSPLS